MEVTDEISLESLRLSNPEALTDDQMGGLLAAVGNHEGKALTLIGMEPGVAYGISALHQRFIEIQGDQVVFQGNIRNQLDYCTESFEGVGAVAKAVFSKTLKFEVTDYGAVFGKALAGHMLSLSHDHDDFSLRNIFGMTKTKAEGTERPPIKRLEMIKSILGSGGNTTYKKLCRELGVDMNTLSNQARGLANSGLIEVETITLKDVKKFGYFVPHEITNFVKYGEQPRLTENVVNALNECSVLDDTGVVTIDDVESFLRTDPRYKDKTALRSNIGSVLAHLAREGHLTPGRFTSRKLSKVSIAEGKEQILQKIVDISDKIQNLDVDFIEEGLDLAEKIINDEQKVRKLVKKAYENSPEANGVPKEVRHMRVGRFLLEVQIASTSQIVSALETHGVTKSSTIATLADMRKKGLVESTKDGTENIWALVSTTN